MSDLQVIHSIPGRVRFRFSHNGSTPEDWQGFESNLSGKTGIHEVRLNALNQSMVVVYDEQQWNPEKIKASLNDTSAKLRRTKKGKESARGESLQKKPPVEFFLSTAAVALPWLIESLAGLTPFLLAGSAIPIFKRAYQSLTERKRLNVDVLDASATAVLMAQQNFPTAAFMVWMVNLADIIRDKTMEHSRKAISGVLDFQNRKAWVLRDGKKIQVPVDGIGVGETVIVYPGERIPIDGIVTSGTAYVDQQTLTGESMPIEKKKGDLVYAATVVREGKLYIDVKAVGDDTEAAKIVHLIQDAAPAETRIQNYAEVWADQLVPASFAGAGVSAVLRGNVEAASSLLIIDYGTGIRVAAPTTVLASMARAARRGILVKAGRHLENLAQVDAILFDKTGTLTTGVPELLEVISLDKHFNDDRILGFAAAAERRLTHPVARAVVNAAEKRGVHIPERTTSTYSLGLGVTADIEGHHVNVGNLRFMESKGVRFSETAVTEIERVERRIASPLCVAFDGKLAGVLAYADPLRPEAPEVIQALRDRGIKEIMIVTGDHPVVAQTVADALKISRFTANVLPRQKVEAVRTLQREGFKVCVVGDGINDSPALAQADVGIAVSGGVDIAQESAHIILLRGSLWKIPLTIDICREGMALIRQNWKLIAIPNTLAMTGAVLGLVGPVGATIISNGSAILAGANALRPLLARPYT